MILPALRVTDLGANPEKCYGLASSSIPAFDREQSDSMDYHHIGRPVTRVEGADKVTGREVHAIDVTLPGMLWAKSARSPKKHLIPEQAIGKLRMTASRTSWAIGKYFRLCAKVAVRIRGPARDIH